MYDNRTSNAFSAQSGITGTNLIVALLAAAIGALAWGAVTYFSGYEVGYVAWGLGALVGAAMVKFGGRDMACAAAAAVLTVVGIAGGKLIATHFVVEKEFRAGCAETFTRELHAALQQDAVDFAELEPNPTDSELRLFMVERGFTPAGSPAQVQPKEVQEFLSTTAPELRSMRSNPPSYETWYAHHVAESRRAFEAEFSIVQANLDELSGFDLLWVFLGVSTAFGIVRRSGSEEAQPASARNSGSAKQDYRRAA
jgi:hypothetical protein